jgi:hypothetical protein
VAKPDRAAIVGELWRRGTLRKVGGLHSDQQLIHAQYSSTLGRVFVLCCSRRWGKSMLCCLLALECALSTAGAQVRYAAPTGKMARRIVVPHMRKLLAQCPADLRPRFAAQDLTWTFPNGSEIVLAGCDNGNAENLRGTSMNLGIVDEGGFIDDLDYVITSILLPQTMTTGGRIFIASSPARTPTHAFTTICLRAEAEGRYAHRTIHDAPHITPALIAEFMAECGGEDTTDWLREYLAQTVVDESIAVLPEFTPNAVSIVQERERPPFFHCLVSIDGGFEDLAFALFGYHDFGEDVLYVEDERVWHRQNSGTVSTDIKAAEAGLWGTKRPEFRVFDADATVRNDMNTMHDLSCRLPRKDDKFAQVNALRVALKTGRIRIHPRCKALIAHCKGAIWNKGRTSFERADGFGHYDGVDALVYMWRHTDRQANPYPAGYGINRHTQWALNAPGKEHALAGIVKPLRRR